MYCTLPMYTYEMISFKMTFIVLSLPGAPWQEIRQEMAAHCPTEPVLHTLLCCTGWEPSNTYTDQIPSHSHFLIPFYYFSLLALFSTTRTATRCSSMWTTQPQLKLFTGVHTRSQTMTVTRYTSCPLTSICYFSIHPNLSLLSLTGSSATMT